MREDTTYCRQSWRTALEILRLCLVGRSGYQHHSAAAADYVHEREVDKELAGLEIEVARDAADLLTLIGVQILHPALFGTKM